MWQFTTQSLSSAPAPHDRLLTHAHQGLKKKEATESVEFHQQSVHVHSITKHAHGKDDNACTTPVNP
jgi:hypothetical protein